MPPVLAVRTALKQATLVGREKHEVHKPPHVSAALQLLYKHKKHLRTEASLVKATSQVPSEKVTKIPWRIKALVASRDGGVGLHVAGGPEGAHDFGRRAPGPAPRSSGIKQLRGAGRST